MQPNNAALFNAQFPQQAGMQGGAPRQYNAAPMTAMPVRGGAAAGLPAGAPIPGQTAAQIGLKPHEKSRFDSLFYSCEGSRGIPSAVNGAAIKNLFTASRLPKSSLAQVWTLADRQKRKSLDLEDFYIACRLIAIAQQNLPVSYQSLMNYTDIPLPSFEGVTQAGAAAPTAQMQMPAMQQQGQQAQPRKMAPMTSAGPGLGNAPGLGAGAGPALGGPNRGMDLLGGGGGVAGGFQQPAASFPVTLGRSPSAAGGSAGSFSGGMAPASSPQFASATPDEWTMTDAERGQYLALFSQADQDQDGLVGGKEANLFFKQSGLDNATLKQIWLLSDVDKDNKLNPDEFSIAMHLTLRVRKKQPLPLTLPQSMLPRNKQAPSMPMNNGLMGFDSMQPMQPQQQQPQPSQGDLTSSGKRALNLDLMGEMLPQTAPAPLPSLQAPPPQQQTLQPPAQQDFMSFGGGSSDASNLPGSRGASKPASRRTSMDAGSYGFAPQQQSQLGAAQAPGLQKQQSYGFSSLMLNTGSTPSNAGMQQSQPGLMGFGAASTPASDASKPNYALIDATQAYEDRSTQLQILQAQTEAGRGPAAAADARLQEKLAAVQQIEAQVAAQQALLDEQRRHLAEMEAQSTEAVARAADAKRRLAEAQDLLRNGETRKRELQDSVSQAKRETAELDSQLSLLDSQLTSLRSSLKSMEDLKSNQASIVQARRDQQNRLLHEKRDLQDMVDACKLELARMKAEADLMKQNLKTHQEGVDAMHAILDEHKDIVNQERLKPSPRAEPFVLVNKPGAGGAGNQQSPQSQSSNQDFSPAAAAGGGAQRQSPMQSQSLGASSSSYPDSSPQKAKQAAEKFFQQEDDAFRTDDIDLPALGAPAPAPSPSQAPVTVVLTPSPQAVSAAPAATSAPAHAGTSPSAAVLSPVPPAHPKEFGPTPVIVTPVGAPKVATIAAEWNTRSRNASVSGDWTKPAAGASASAHTANDLKPTPLPGAPSSPAVGSSPNPTALPPPVSTSNISPQNGSAGVLSPDGSVSSLVSPPAPAPPNFPQALQGTGVPDFAADMLSPGSGGGAESGNPWDDDPVDSDPFGAPEPLVAAATSTTPSTAAAPAVVSPRAASIFGEEDDPFGAPPSEDPFSSAAAAPAPAAAAAPPAAAPSPVAAAAAPAPAAAGAVDAFGAFDDFDAFGSAAPAPAPVAAAPAAVPAPAAAAAPAPAAASPAAVTAPTSAKASVAASFDAAMAEDWAAFD